MFIRIHNDLIRHITQRGYADLLAFSADALTSTGYVGVRSTVLGGVVIRFVCGGGIVRVNFG